MTTPDLAPGPGRLPGALAPRWPTGLGVLATAAALTSDLIVAAALLVAA